MPTRRNVLAAVLAVTGTGLAGCTDGTSDDEESPADTGDGQSNDGSDETTLGPAVGVAAEWNAIRARVHDAYALGIAEEFAAGAAVAGDTLARFEAATDEWGAHERLEETDHDAYEEFEEALEELRMDALEEEDVERAATEAEIADEQLQNAQEEVLSYRNGLALDMGAFAARIGDVATLASAGAFDAAATIADEVDERWEESIVHDEVSAADGELYADFEGELPDLESTAADGDLEGVRTAAENAITAAYDAAYVLAEDEVVAHASVLSGMQARGWDAATLASLEVDPETAADVARGTLQRFESARVHDAVEHADHATYEAFEDELEAYVGSLSTDDGVDEAAESFAEAALRAQFAVADALEDAPGESEHEHDHDDHADEDLEGGPNVVEGVPDDADHVVEIHAASFEPEELTVQSGDTVAFEHVEGEPHTVTAYEDDLPEDATYWASGDFEDEDAARDGWADGRGAIVSGHSYVHTFEVEGTHEFCCIPHEAAGQTGRIVVE
ncbi:DUF5059 domain-containing protein [Halopiger goleimassiliensis]|uniref:DUF5059 domain-containing protein n=1 Tax=Halopiger goleimassiliensis TaxID=1293048 RepID=UPI000677E504|nr:DUF5059 domain-containing protein [Halopiger goleimassiliensis]